jgi:cyd operon protein YbgT
MDMWYFCWVIGMGAALGFGIINAMWLEAHSPAEAEAGDGN